MDSWINRVLMGCGGVAGLLLGTGLRFEASLLLAVGIGCVWILRQRDLPIAKE